MQHLVSPAALERAPPTLWPLIPQDDTQMALALEACEVENRRLRTLVDQACGSNIENHRSP